MFRLCNVLDTVKLMFGFVSTPLLYPQEMTEKLDKMLCVFCDTQIQVHIEIAPPTHFNNYTFPMPWHTCQVHSLWTTRATVNEYLELSEEYF